MKRLFFLLSALLFTLSAFSQTKMIITKSNGTDSIWLSDIKSITFKTYIPVANQNLLAWYPFSGNPADSSGNGYNGTDYGATLTTDRFGNENSAYHFEGGTYISIPELFPSTVSAFTFAVWVMKDTSDFMPHTILYKGLDQGEASIGITNNPHAAPFNLGFGVNLSNGDLGGQNWYSVNSPDTLKAKSYYFLVGRYIEGQKIDFSINGKIIDSLVVPNLFLAQWSGHSYSGIGVHTTFLTTTGWDGIIDDVRIYGRAISDDEVQALYHEKGWTGN
jgi:hypothetical protein